MVLKIYDLNCAKNKIRTHVHYANLCRRAFFKNILFCVVKAFFTFLILFTFLLIYSGISLAAELSIEEFFQLSEIESGIKKELTSETLLERSKSDSPACFIDDELPENSKEILPFKFSDSHPFSGSKNIVLDAPGKQTSYFTNKNSQYAVGADENIVFYVRIPAGKAPEAFAAAFYDESGVCEHRVYFGANVFNFDGEEGSFSNYNAGSVPAVYDIWHRISIPASSLNMGGRKICGIVLFKSGGEIHFDKFTKSPAINDSQKSAAEPVENILTVYKNSFLKLGIKASPEAAPESPVTIDVAYENGDTYTKETTSEVDGVIMFDLTDNAGVVLPSGNADITVRYDDKNGVSQSASINYDILQLIANIQVPWNDSIVNFTMPVFGDALGYNFSHYRVTMENITNPLESPEVILESKEPKFLTNHRLSFSGKATVHGNLCSVDVGSNFKYMREVPDYIQPIIKQTKYNGKYRIKLEVFDIDGNVRTDHRDIIIGRFLSNPVAKFAESDDCRAALFVPAYAITEGFTLCSLINSDKLLPADSEVLNNPGYKLISSVYRARPRALRFDRPAVLKFTGFEQKLDAKKHSIFKYDSWRGYVMLPSQVDDSNEITAQIAGLNEKGKTYFAVFEGDIDALKKVPEKIEEIKVPLPEQPLIEVNSETHPFFLQCDFENGNYCLVPRSLNKNCELKVERDKISGRRYLKVINKKQPSDNAVFITTKKYDAREFPVLSFEYKCPETFETNILINAGGYYFEMPLTKNVVSGEISRHKTLNCPRMIRDGAWHSYSVNLYEMLRNVMPSFKSNEPILIDEIFFGNYNRAGYCEISDGDNEPGASMCIDNIAITTGGSADKNVKFTWKSNDKNITQYIYSVDNQPLSTPKTAPKSDVFTEFKAEAKSSDQAQNDEWYLHIAGVYADGKTQTNFSHYKIKVDNTPPKVVETSPKDGEKTSSAVITAKIDDGDGSGVCAGSLECEVDGLKYKLGDGALTYDSSTKTMKLEFFKAKPVPPGFIDGQSVRVKILNIKDNANNSIDKPYEFSFIIDYSSMTAGKDFLLTQSGGTYPAWTPDSRNIIFVSNKAGKFQLYSMPLIERKAFHISKDTAADYITPAVLADGRIIASKRQTGGNYNLVIMSGDGSGEKVLTDYKGFDSISPACSRDGKKIVFSRNNDIYMISPDGGEAEKVIADVNAILLEPSFSYDGKKIIYRQNLYSNTIWSCYLTGDNNTPITVDGNEFEPSYSADGSKILFTQKTDVVSAVFSANSDGSEITQLLKSDICQMRNAKMSPDGKMIAYESTRTGIWNISIFQLVYTPPIENEVIKAEEIIKKTQGAQNQLEIKMDTKPESKPDIKDMAAVKLNYETSDDSTLVTAYIYNRDNKVIKKLASDQRHLQGKHYFLWDGTDETSKPVDKNVPYIVKYEFKTAGSAKPAVKVSKIGFTDSAKKMPVDFMKLRGEVQKAEEERITAEKKALENKLEIMVKGKDTEPPSAVADFTAIAGVGQVELKWSKNSESDIAGYIIVKLKKGDNAAPQKISIPAAQTNLLDRSVENGSEYSYSIYAEDVSGNQSPHSRNITAIPEFDYIFSAVNLKDKNYVLKFNQNNLEIDFMEAFKSVSKVSIIAPPNFTESSKISFTSGEAGAAAFCYDTMTSDLYMAKSYDLKAYGVWKLMHPVFEQPASVSGKASFAFTFKKNDAVTAVCFDPLLDELYYADIQKIGQRFVWKKVGAAFMSAPNSTGVISADFKDGKYILYSVNPIEKSAYKCMTADFKTWTPWKKF